MPNFGASRFLTESDRGELMLANLIETVLLIAAVWVLVSVVIGLRIGKLFQKPEPRYEIPEYDKLFGFVMSPYARRS